MAEYLAVNGRMPSHLEQVGHIPGNLPSDALMYVDLTQGGTLELMFDSKRGASGFVRLIPRVNLTESRIVGWECTSYNVSDIAQAVADCRYQPLDPSVPPPDLDKEPPGPAPALPHLDAVSKSPVQGLS